jgi:hypothetical protein
LDSEVQALSEAFSGTAFTVVNRLVSVKAGSMGAASAGALMAVLLQLGKAAWLPMRRRVVPSASLPRVPVEYL